LLLVSKRALQWRALNYSLHSLGSGEDIQALRLLAPLPPTLPPDGSLFLPLSLSARLLIEAALPKLGIKAGTLDLPLEPT